MDPVAESSLDILRTARPANARNQAISQIASDLHYVPRTLGAEDLAEALGRDDSISAVGVVDGNDRTLGIVSRKDFYALLSRPYGRDVLRNLNVTEVMTEARTFKADTNLFTIAEELDTQLESSEITFFPMEDEEGRFCGIFSTHDLLLYLSQMTQNDIDLARRLQSRLVRERELVVGQGFEVAAYSASARGVGGDFYAVQQATEDRWIISLCDVSGKGVSASVVTSVIYGMMSIYDFRRGMRPFIRKLNDFMVRTFEAEKFVTGLFMVFDETDSTLQIYDMGHSHIFAFRDGRLLRVSTNQSNLPLGVVAETQPRASRFTPRENDVLLFVTDGLLEQKNVAGEEYSIERVGRLLQRHASRPVEVLSDRIIDDFESFRGNHHLTDDVTYGIMKFGNQEVTL
jgi:sigma-B regulation protein RsbU (phosphoserine phosphatase)